MSADGSSFPDTIRPVLRALSDPFALARSLGLLRRKFHRQAQGLSVLCPLHGEKHSPSLSLQRYSDGRLGWRCFACGAHGDALDLIARVALELDPAYRRRASDLRQVLARAYSLAGLAHPAPASPWLVPARLAPLPAPPLEPPPSPPAERWADPAAFDLAARALLRACPLADLARATLTPRGVWPEALADGWGELAGLPATAPSRPEDAPGGLQSRPAPTHAHAGALPVGWQALLATLPPAQVQALGWLGGHERLLHPSHRLLLPWRRDDGSIWVVQRRQLPPAGGAPPPAGPKYLMPPASWTGGEVWPYGIDHPDLRTADEVWICEGAIDVLALRALNRQRPTPRPLAALGLPGVTRWRKALEPALPWLQGRHVVLALDADRAGRDAIADLGAAMHQAGAARVSDKSPPPGAKDWADVTAQRWRQGQPR